MPMSKRIEAYSEEFPAAARALEFARIERKSLIFPFTSKNEAMSFRAKLYGFREACRVNKHPFAATLRRFTLRLATQASMKLRLSGAEISSFANGEEILRSIDRYNYFIIAELSGALRATLPPHIEAALAVVEKSEVGKALYQGKTGEALLQQIYAETMQAHDEDAKKLAESMREFRPGGTRAQEPGRPRIEPKSNPANWVREIYGDEEDE